MTLTKSITYLKAASFATAGFAALMILALMGIGTGALNFFADLAHLPLDGAQQVQTDTEKLAIAIAAGLMLGLAMFVYQATVLIYAEDPEKGAKIIVSGLLTWYIADGIGSLVAGAWFNVVMNSLFLALFLVPIFLAHRKIQQWAN